MVDSHSGQILVGHNRVAIETLHLISLYAISGARFGFSIREENISLNVMN